MSTTLHDNGKVKATEPDKPYSGIAGALLNMERALSLLADQYESNSPSNGDKWGKPADGCVDSMDSIRNLRKKLLLPRIKSAPATR
jgi:hypothetical protein